MYRSGHCCVGGCRNSGRCGSRTAGWNTGTRPHFDSARWLISARGIPYMNRRNFGAEAASIVDDLMARGDDALQAEVRGPLGIVIRIGFEVLELLDSTVLELLEVTTTKENALDWTHETICAGC